MKTAHQNQPTPQTSVDVANKAYVDGAVTGGGMLIGGSVSGGTPGSLLFIATGPVLAQNNTNLFWDNVNGRLGVGTNLPGAVLDILGAGATSAIAFFGGSAAPVSVAGSGRIRFNESTNKFQISQNGAAYVDIATGAATMAIGASVTGATAGSVLFAATGPVLAQDNANFFWDNTNKRLGLGVTPTVTLDVVGRAQIVGSSAIALNVVTTFANDVVAYVRNHSTTGYSSIGFFDNVDAFQGYLGYSNGTSTVGPGNFNFYAIAGKAWNFWNSVDNNSGVTIAASGAGTVSIQMQNGSSAAVSAANTGSLIYNNTTHKFQVSLNGAAYVDLSTGAGGGSSIGGAVTGGTAGSVLFVATGPVLAQDNTNFFWDSTNKRLGIGTNAPGLSLNVTSAAAADVVGVHNTNAAGYSTTAYFDNTTPTAALKMSLGYANTSAADAKVKGRSFVHYEADLTFATTTSNNAYFNVGNGFVGIGVFDGTTTVPQTRLHVYGSDNPTIVRIQSTGAPGSGRFEFYSDPMTSANQWRPGYFQSEDEGSFTGSVVFYTNGTGSGAKFGTTEAARFTNGSIQLAAGSFATNSSASRGRIRYNESTQKIQTSLNTGAYFDLPQLAAALTTGSVPFSNSSGQLAQDNANFFWDATNTRLGIGTAAPGYQLDLRRGATTASQLHIRGGATSDDGGWLSSQAAGQLILSGGAAHNGTTWVPKATGASHIDVNTGQIEFYNDTGLTVGGTYNPTARAVLFGSNFNIGPTVADPAIRLRIEASASAAGIELGNGGSTAVSGANVGRLIYNSTGQKFQVSANTAAYLDVAILAAALTTGSVPFADASGHLAQNNTKLFWDNTNFRLGIGTATPAQALDVQGIINQKAHAAFTGSDSVRTTVAIQTVDATVTAIFTFAVPDNTVFGLKWDIACRDTAGVERALFGKAALVYRQAASAATIQGTEVTNRDIHTNPSLSSNVAVSGNNVQITVTGLAATTINWVATVYYQAVSGNT